jgi:acyl carrier protein
VVSLSAISEALSSHPAVRRAEAAIVRHQERDVAVAAAELSAYVSGPMLRDHARRELGEDCGLAAVLIVEEIPTADGALDAARLASAVAQGRCALFEEPRDEVERRVAAIWSEQLGVPSPGVHDHFLDLGGDSLSALRVIAAVEEEFGRPLDVYELMNAGSVRPLADLLR